MGQQQKVTDSTAEQITTEDEILELAKKELLRDIKCASMRAEQFGAHSWAKPQKYVPSKRFLRHMLVSASRDNHRKSALSKGSKASKVTSAVIYKSKKNEHSVQKEKNNVRKRSRWDSSPEHDKSNSHNKNTKERMHHHVDKHKSK